MRAYCLARSLRDLILFGQGLDQLQGDLVDEVVVGLGVQPEAPVLVVWGAVERWVGARRVPGLLLFNR